MLLRFLPYYAADDEGGSSGGSGDDQGKVKPSDVLARYGQTAESALRMAEKLAESENTNWQLREKNRTLREERTALQSKIPADGAVTLSAEDAALLESYRALGKPSDLKATLDTAVTTTAELTTLKRTETLRAAAEAHSYKLGALAKLPSLKDQEITFKDVDVKGADGKPVKAKHAYIGTVSLPDYIKEHDAEFLTSLTADPPKPSGDGVGSPANGRRPASANELTIQPRAII